MNKEIKAEMSEAKSCGLARFFSETPCELCLCEIRDTETGACIDCMAMAHEKSALFLKRQAAMLGLKYFVGLKCPDCGDVHKYTANRSCVSCANQKARDRYRKDPAKAAENTRRWREKNREYYTQYNASQYEMRKSKKSVKHVDKGA